MTSAPFPVSLLSAPLLRAINHVLDQAQWATARLQPFAGRAVRIAMPPFAFSFAIGSDGRLQNSTGEPDLDVVLPSNTPLLAMQGGDRAMKAAQISGPADLADALSFVLRNLRWDIEEDLSKVFGDIAARRIASALAAFATWQRQAARNTAENIGEYLTEENRALVRSAEIAAFADEVQQLRSDLARIEARIKLQEKKP